MTPQPIALGLKAFPLCEECQCYPEGRIDCPDSAACMVRLGSSPHEPPELIAHPDIQKAVKLKRLL
jgi:hypothetical protein